tara:strand:- start:378 stop:749 length:372 start_codon:yes stop_codon:yes gene_type:complete
MTVMKKLLIATLTVLPTNMFAEDLLLNCRLDNGSTRHFLVSPDKSTVQLIDNVEADICDLKVLPHMYIWNCSQTEKLSAQQGMANRFTGRFESEIGGPPFGELDLDNLLRVGSCEQATADLKY